MFGSSSTMRIRLETSAFIAHMFLVFVVSKTAMVFHKPALHRDTADIRIFSKDRKKEKLIE